MPDLDVGLVCRCRLCFDTPLHSRAIPDIREDEPLDTEVGNHLSGPGAKRAVRARDQDRLAFEGFGRGGEPGILLLANHPPWENLCQ